MFIIVLTTLAMYTSTTVFAGLSHSQLNTYVAFPYHVEPAQNQSTGGCAKRLRTGPAVVFTTNFTAPFTRTCPLDKSPAAVYGGRITGNVQTPIAMLYFLPLAFAGGILLAIVLAIAVVEGRRRLRLAAAAGRAPDATLAAMNDTSDPRNNKTFVAATTDHEALELKTADSLVLY
jgi:hypothetical protein